MDNNTNNNEEQVKTEVVLDKKEQVVEVIEPEKKRSKVKIAVLLGLLAAGTVAAVKIFCGSSDGVEPGDFTDVVDDVVETATEENFTEV